MKIIINSSIINSSENIFAENIIGNLDNNIITYISNKEDMKIEILDNAIKISRATKESNIALKLINSKNTKGQYEISGINKIIMLKIFTKKLIIDKNNIKAEYEIYINNELSDCFKFTLDWRKK